MSDVASVRPTGLTSTDASAPTRPTAQGYDRADLDRYLATCAQERATLERELAAARARIARARSALDAQRVLTSMVSEVCSEISAKRRQADLVVARIATAGMDVEPEAALTACRTPEPVDPFRPTTHAPAGTIRWRATNAASVDPAAAAVR